MHFNLLQLLLATSLVPLSAAIQTIYLAAISSSGGPGSFIAFFSDSDPCKEGTPFGSLNGGFDNCDQDLTILGHENITFTGCAPYTGFPGSLPTGVSDGGAPALTCNPASNPPGSLYGVYASCPPDEGNVDVGFVNLKEYCS